MNALDPLSGQAAQLLMTQLDARRQELAYFNHSLPGLVIGTGSAAKVKTTNTTTYNSGGAVVTQNATTHLMQFATQATAATGAVSPPFPAVGKGLTKASFEIAFAVGAPSNVATGFDQYFWVCLDAAGNGYLVPGLPAAVGTAKLPQIPFDFTGISIAGPSPTPVVNQSPGTSAAGIVGYNNATLSNGTVVQGGIAQRLVTIIGYVLISNASGAPFVAGTTLLSAAGLPVTYSDMMGSPGPLFAQQM